MVGEAAFVFRTGLMQQFIGGAAHGVDYRRVADVVFERARVVQHAMRAVPGDEGKVPRPRWRSPGRRRAPRTGRRRRRQYVLPGRQPCVFVEGSPVRQRPGWAHAPVGDPPKRVWQRDRPQMR